MEYTYSDAAQAHGARRRYLDKGIRSSLVAFDPERGLYVFDTEEIPPRPPILGVTVKPDGTMSQFEGDSENLLQSLYATIGCTIVEVVWQPLEDITIWVDEEGLFVEDPQTNHVIEWFLRIVFGGSHHHIVGTAVITGGVDEDGNTLGLTEVQLSALFSKLTAWNHQ